VLAHIAHPFRVPVFLLTCLLGLPGFRSATNAKAAAQGQTQVQAQAETLGRTVFAPQVTDLSVPAQQFVTNLYEGFLQRGPDGLRFGI
jgi:hypothetical protein